MAVLREGPGYNPARDEPARAAARAKSPVQTAYRQAWEQAGRPAGSGGVRISQFADAYRRAGGATANAARPQPRPTSNAAPQRRSSGGGGGGGRRGGGGGGGGAAGPPGLTQATIDAMAGFLGRRPSTVDLPDFVATPMAAFDGSIYDSMAGRVGEAEGRDTANIAQTYGALQQSMPNTNAYASASWAQSPQMQQAMAGMVGGGVGGDQAAATQEVMNQQRGGDAAFGALMGMLGATQEGVNSSRRAQIGMDQNTANQNVSAQAFGARSGIDMARSRAQQEWARANEERNFQNSMAQQQWAREEAQYNADQNQQWRGTVLQPVIDLLMQGNGVQGLNYDALMKLLGG